MSGSLDYDIRFWQLSTGDCRQKIDWISKEGHRGVIRALKADSWRVVSGADDKTIKVRLEKGSPSDGSQSIGLARSVSAYIDDRATRRMRASERTNERDSPGLLKCAEEREKKATDG